MRFEQLAITQCARKRRWIRHFELEEKKRIHELQLARGRGLEIDKDAATDSSSHAYKVLMRNIRSKTPGTSESLRQLSDVGEEYLSEVVSKTTKRISKMKLQQSNCFCNFSNFDDVFKLGFKLLQRSASGILANDKDGGFCLIGRDIIENEQDRI